MIYFVSDIHLSNNVVLQLMWNKFNIIDAASQEDIYNYVYEQMEKMIMEKLNKNN